jgi:hypothetical protein
MMAESGMFENESSHLGSLTSDRRVVQYLLVQDIGRIGNLLWFAK